MPVLSPQICMYPRRYLLPSTTAPLLGRDTIQANYIHVPTIRTNKPNPISKTYIYQSSTINYISHMLKLRVNLHSAGYKFETVIARITFVWKNIQLDSTSHQCCCVLQERQTTQKHNIIRPEHILEKKRNSKFSTSIKISIHSESTHPHIHVKPFLQTHLPSISVTAKSGCLLRRTQT